MAGVWGISLENDLGAAKYIMCMYIIWVDFVLCTYAAIYLSIVFLLCLYIHWFVYLFIYLFMYLFIYLVIYLFI